MDTVSASICGLANKGKERKVFDWVQAARIIKKRGAKNARAGLADDWEWTGVDILKNGVPVPQEDTCVYLASNWATPELNVDGEVMDCYKMQSETPGWDSDTYWPEEARKELGV